jgi:hypothetical protein
MAREAVAESFKFDINAFADSGGVQAASARNALRRAQITPQNGNKYGWKSKTEMSEDWDSIRANGSGEAKSNGKKAEAKSTKKTTAKATVRKPAKKVAAKKAAPRRSKRQEADNESADTDSGE